MPLTPESCNLKPKVKERIIFIVGPTAIGKSAVAAELAKKIGGEIVSCDSMQIYKGMDIITSLPPAALQKKVRHHLLALIPPTAEFNVSAYRKEAVKKIKEITGKGKVPVFCGGTGLYVNILIDGIFKAKTEDPKWRKKLYLQLEKYGKDYLYKKLRRVDPSAARRIHPHDSRRVIRALEVFKATGKPLSGWQKERKGLRDNYAIRAFCLNMDRAALYERIERRVDAMFKAGLLKEARRILRRKLSRTAGYAIGIRELSGYFQGKYGLEEASRLMKINTRRYAKRQLTWFRKDKRIRWINVRQDEPVAETAGRIWKELS